MLKKKKESSKFWAFCFCLSKFVFTDYTPLNVIPNNGYNSLCYTIYLWKHNIVNQLYFNEKDKEEHNRRNK